jgi:4-hydroxybenzoate polyprenyltransferase
MSSVAILVARRVKALLEAMRPRHWVKNIVVFAAPLFALVLNIGPLLRVGWAFVAFSMTASAFYLINDVRDIEEDRQHPVKKHRPIAEGRVSVSVALIVAAGCLAVGLVGSYLVAPWLAVTIGAYAFIQTGYNLGLKEQPILDIMVIASGFVLRALGGAAAAGVPASGWFILCIGLLAFFLGIEKRKAELKALGEEPETRSVLQYYSLSLLGRMESVVTSGALMAYALWTLEGADRRWMLLTVPVVGYAIFRYQYLTEQGEGEEPEKVLLSDVGMIIAAAVWAGLILAILSASL